ncbi:serine protease inhibitor Cvsi-2-like [Haliotis rubra]|uniref:serine protease inhibitor Cvsi-2-like n=1 Tax=Haliotis rubra TaxID=36100 RepID=UPI001EE6300A|nr:serine protease inhibitor Cvsi-2-like [Haliotis rubra]
MKVTLFFVIVSAVIAMIYSETCGDDSDCAHVTCSSGSRLACSHGHCTCLVAANAGTCLSATCTARADCDSCQCRDSHAGTQRNTASTAIVSVGVVLLDLVDQACEGK